MDNQSMSRYVKYISSELGILRDGKMITSKRIVPLPRLYQDGKGGYTHAYLKGVFAPNVEVTIEPIKIYTRSIELRLTFDKYTVNKIFFMSRRKSPESLMVGFKRKLRTTVVDTFIEDGRENDMIEMFDEKTKRVLDIMPNAFKKK